MDSLPLVSIICLCYNQKRFVASAIRSALSQTYAHIELIVVDDGSKDGSKEEIRSVLADKNIQFIDLDKNVGNCKAFNLGYRASRGEYLIDLAADDVLLPTRVELGINDFANTTENVGVHFTDAFLINEAGRPLGTHYCRTAEGKIKQAIPSGNIYCDLISRYFICPPTMMTKRVVFDNLNGYDESLRYEDFDFWIRSSRNFDYLFNPAPLLKYRKVAGSHGGNQQSLKTKQQQSTLHVCEKILSLNQSELENQSLIKRCWYEIRQCAKTLNWGLISEYWKLIKRAKVTSAGYHRTQA